MNSLSKINKINDLCLFVKDFKGTVEFFTKKFGFELKRLQPNEKDANYAEFNFKGTSLTLWQRDGVTSVIDQKYLAKEGHNYMIAIKVDTVEDVNEIHNKFKKNGVVCIKEPQDYIFGSRAAYYLDCERNIWEIFAWLDGKNGPGLLNQEE